MDSRKEIRPALARKADAILVLTPGSRREDWTVGLVETAMAAGTVVCRATLADVPMSVAARIDMGKPKTLGILHRIDRKSVLDPAAHHDWLSEFFESMAWLGKVKPRRLRPARSRAAANGG